MRLLKIFQASFEESLNLEDELASISYKNWQDSQKQTRVGYFGLAIFFLLALVIPIGTIVGGSYIVRHYILKGGINYIPLPIAVILVTLFCLLIFVMSRYNRHPHLEFYQGQFFQYFYILLITTCLHLFLLTMFSRELKVVGAFTWSLCNLILFLVLLAYRLMEIQQILYTNNGKSKTFSSGFLRGFGMILVVFIILYYVYKWFFSSDTSSLETVLPLILLIWGVGGLGVAIIVNTFFLPNIIKGYYHRKYEEEYRNWENASHQEWYGESYHYKDIKGIERENKHVK